MIIRKITYFKYSTIQYKRLFCDVQRVPKKNDEVVPTNPEIKENGNGKVTLESIRSMIVYQVTQLSPTTSKTGKLILLAVIFVLIVIIWNLDKIREINKRNRIVRYDRLFFEKRFRELIETTTESILKQGCSEDYYFRGLAYFMINDEKKALQDFREVVESQDSHMAHVSSSLCYSSFAFCELGRFEEALQVAEEAIKINPYSSVSYKGKGEALIGLKRWNEALIAFDESLKIDPDNCGCINSKIAIYQKLKMNESALELIDQCLSKDMFNQETHKHKVKILFDLNNFEKVVQHIELIESLFGTSSFLYYLKGDALTQLGKYQDALTNIDNALFVNQGNLSREILDRMLYLKYYCQKQLYC